MRNKNKNNIITVSFFSRRTKMENGEVVSEEGGFYLEKSDNIKNLCYKKDKFMTSVPVSRKTFQRLKSLTSGIILERAKSNFVSKDYIFDSGDDRDDPFESLYNDDIQATRKKFRSSYQSQTKSRDPKDIAPFIMQIFIPE